MTTYAVSGLAQDEELAFFPAQDVLSFSGTGNTPEYMRISVVDAPGESDGESDDLLVVAYGDFPSVSVYLLDVALGQLAGANFAWSSAYAGVVLIGDDDADDGDGDSDSDSQALAGTGNDDFLVGLGGTDTLSGGDGHDFLDGGPGADVLDGGGRSDTYVATVGDVIVEADTLGEEAGVLDTVYTSTSWTLTPGLEVLYITGRADREGTGNERSNSLYGNSGDNVLRGLGGMDDLHGHGGNDTLWGGTEDDLLLSGGRGNDRLYGQAGMDYLAGRAGDDFLAGGADRDHVYGDDGNDTLSGGAGDDEMSGSGGIDVVDGGGGSDRIFWDANDGQVDGGAGSDSLWVPAITGDVVLDLAGLAGTVLTNFEKLDFYGTAHNVSVQFTFAEAQALSSTTDRLMILGESGDSVQSSGWTLAEQHVQIGSQYYDRYTQGSAVLLIDEDIVANVTG